MTGADPALIEAAHSPNWLDRQRAGRRLARSLTLDPPIAGLLHQLLLDRENSAVTREVATALFETGDFQATRIVVRALMEADELAGAWIETAAQDSTQTDGTWTRLVDQLQAIRVQDDDAAVAGAAARLLVCLTVDRA